MAWGHGFDPIINDQPGREELTLLQFRYGKRGVAVVPAQVREERSCRCSSSGTGSVFKVRVVPTDDFTQLPDPGHIDVVLRTPPDHERLLRFELRELHTDRSDIITDTPAR